MAGNTNHVFAVETDSAKEEKLTYIVDAEAILLDLKVLMREVYVATFSAEGDALKLQFSNGQTFVLSVKEVL